ncbi:hypothetical protein NDU88_000491 [Pleurodeles waltl]|uniref:Uncharacterized protein n=1 Tax=Pleurodeles waltl TaxID=8319 RepID=A0AAV7P9V1_PLEWA|nr:hypothetical protein NDU88_000491 [Pleurodeles waltl]
MRRDRRGERTNKEDVELGESKEEEDVERAEESSKRSSEADRAWETEFPAEDGQMPKVAKIRGDVDNAGTGLFTKPEYLFLGVKRVM